MWNFLPALAAWQAGAAHEPGRRPRFLERSGWSRAVPIHYALPDETGHLVPLCGVENDPSWTILRHAVTCPECIRWMGGEAMPSPPEMSIVRLSPGPSPASIEQAGTVPDER